MSTVHNLSNLSKEEIIAMLLSERENSKRISDERDKLLSENKELKAQVKELKEAVAKKNGLVKKAGIERFVDKSDNAYCHKRKERTGMKPGPTGNPRGRRTGSKNYADMDFEELSKENDVITNDIKDQWLAEHPGCELVEFGEDVSYIVEHVKAHIKVHKVITKKYKTSEGSIIQAKSKSIINHCFAGAGLLSYLHMLKYSLGVPVDRFANLLNQQGLYVSQNTIYKWLMSSADILKPVWEAMAKALVDGTTTCLHIDETNIKVLEDDELNTRKKHYMFLYSTETEGRKIKFFDYTGDRKTERCKELLADYKGTIVVDGYSGYNSMKSDDITIQRCAVHLRRQFTDERKTIPNGNRDDSMVCRVIDTMDPIFAKEREMKKRNLTPLQILEERQSDEYEKLQAALDDLMVELDGSNLSEDMRRLVNYYMNRRYEYWEYLNDGSVECHNNQAERMAKSFQTIARGFLFARTNDSARKCAVLMTMVKTAEANNLYPDDYIEWVLNSLHDGVKPEELMPWSKECEKFKIRKA